MHLQIHNSTRQSHLFSNMLSINTSVSTSYYSSWQLEFHYYLTTVPFSIISTALEYPVCYSSGTMYHTDWKKYLAFCILSHFVIILSPLLHSVLYASVFFSFCLKLLSLTGSSTWSECKTQTIFPQRCSIFFFLEIYGTNHRLIITPTKIINQQISQSM